ncbi:hypothetical protein F2Q70_00004125 [Brassica cretica]|uniref:Uncharacterized protein n=1 Tax=Brassica cretica TaxID=69181 RepID=A0A8S9J0S8_BRACR|nr:hypothetical protein F2Q70_00004125 [Brassica cretica]
MQGDTPSHICRSTCFGCMRGDTSCFYMSGCMTGTHARRHTISHMLINMLRLHARRHLVLLHVRLHVLLPCTATPRASGDTQLVRWLTPRSEPMQRATSSFSVIRLISVFPAIADPRSIPNIFPLPFS